VLVAAFEITLSPVGSSTSRAEVCIPVLHVGQVGAVKAVTVALSPATQWVTVWLWCPHDVAAGRITERGTGTRQPGCGHGLTSHPYRKLTFRSTRLEYALLTLPQQFAVESKAGTAVPEIRPGSLVDAVVDLSP
jgi:hypothetical protein